MNDLVEHQKQDAGPVECLGISFPNDQARREHFQKLLAEKLKNPAFRSQAGFPKGTDEAILAMSDPPYYTACPNPWLEDFMRLYGQPFDSTDGYQCEPFAIDVSVGKTDALYKAHAYHTKVPHLAIVPSILHYTKPGDIVLDGFSGSGMTGIATQWCGQAPAVYRHELEASWKKEGRAKPKWGSRKVVLNDLSPAATFITANYNIPLNIEEFASAGSALLRELKKEVGWMYETIHHDGTSKGVIEYTVWSELFTCPECMGEINFLDEALDAETKKVRDEFPCPHCNATLTKKKLEKLNESFIDEVLGKAVLRPKRVPSLICYVVNGSRYEKKPDAADLDNLVRIGALPMPASMPVDRMMHVSENQEKWGDKWRAGTASFTHVHHLFLPRASNALVRMWESANQYPDLRTRNFLIFMVEQAIWGMSALARYTPTHFSQVNQYLTGVYYVASQIAECSPWYILEGKLGRLVKAFSAKPTQNEGAIVTTGSAGSLRIPNSSIDYIFTDPPFGDNLAYSELNFLVEAFHQVFTRQAPEAVMSNAQSKGLLEYHRLMRECFSEYFRVLKAGRWMTVVFSNTSAAVWNGIQTAIQEAGFVIANVSALSKIQGSFNAVTNATSVKQDLVISAYKPADGVERAIIENGATRKTVWDFVSAHLGQLPVTKIRDGELEFVSERDPRIIFDRMIAWFIKHGASVPMSSQEFRDALASKFFIRDGMVFLQDQATAYDCKRALVTKSPQMDLFVSDERSAIDWLTDFLKSKPSTYQELHPDFITQVGAGWKKHEAKPELSDLLENNFLKYDGAGDVPSQIHTYLSSNFREFRGLDKSDSVLRAKAQDRWYVPDPNKAQDLEKKREKALLKEFAGYVAATGRKLKEFRLEVLRAGFKTAWASRDYQTIIKVAQKIPEDALQEDEKLLLWYDQALTRVDAAS